MNKDIWALFVVLVCAQITLTILLFIDGSREDVAVDAQVPDTRTLVSEPVLAVARREILRHIQGTIEHPLESVGYRDARVSTPFPIDIVYTWYCDTDKRWQRMREKFCGKHNPAIDMDNLRYSIRSVALYAPWIRRVHVLASSHQTPAWLNEDVDWPHGFVNVVNDWEVMAPEHLPTRNSHALECHLHRIQGLSERFLYACDDMYFSAPVRYDQFFTVEHSSVPGGLTRSELSDGLPIVGFTKLVPPVPYEAPQAHNIHHNAMRNSSIAIRDYIRELPITENGLVPSERAREQLLSRFKFREIEHHIVPLRKSVFEELEIQSGTVAQKWNATCAHKHRNYSDLHPAALVANVARLTKRSTSRSGTQRLNSEFYILNDEFEYDRVYESVQHGRVHLLCFNQDCRGKSRERFDLFRERLFPYVCSLMRWERAPK